MSHDQKEIMERVNDLFMKYGIKSVTMDDVARHLHVSKKTLYKHVSDKKELVKEVVKLQSEREKKVIEDIRAKGYNAIDESFEISKYFIQLLQNMHPSIHYDLEKYYPEAWKVFLEFKTDYVQKSVLSNIKSGMKEGLYRKDMDPVVITRIYTFRIDSVFDGETFPSEEFNFSDVYLEMFKYHILGIANEKGKEHLYRKLDQINTSS